MKSFFIVCLALAPAAWALPQTPRTRSDDGCTSIGGTCADYTTMYCTAGWENGLCDGDNNRKCCHECDQTCQDNESSYADGDGACDADNGICMDISNYCDGGVFVGGECGGPSSRECCKEVDLGDCPTLVTRAEWDAREPDQVSYIGDSLDYLFVHHAEGPACYNKADCIKQVQGIQNYHMDSNGWSDIGYSFLVGGDGNLYEGRGLNVQGAHTSGYNTVGYGTCFIGNFMTVYPEQVSIDTYLAFQQCMVVQGKVKSNFEMFGHRQAGSTDCPGDMLYELIQTWPHWTTGSPSK